MKIFRMVLLVPIFFGAVTSSSGQIAVGAKGGLNFNSFRGNKEKKAYEVVPGFNVGGFAEYPVLPFLNAHVEVLYMQQGGNIHDYQVISELNHSHARVAFHTIQVPIMAEFGLPSLNEDNLQPKFLLGFFYSNTFYARENYLNVIRVDGYDKITYDGYSNAGSSFYSSQYGLIAAVAAELKLFSKPVSIEFRYNYNLNRINKAGTQNQYNMIPTHEKWGNDLFLSTLSINVGVTLFYF